MNTLESGGKRGSAKRPVHPIVVIAAILALIIAALAGLHWVVKLKAAHERAQWKGLALARLAALSTTNDLIREELDMIKHPTPNLDFGWTHEHVLLMTNGESIIYEFRHGANNGFVDHLFLGHGSDGRWLYSTYHFCNHMAGAFVDPPGSIAEFEKSYAVRQFDGKSDECLKHTWP